MKLTNKDMKEDLNNRGFFLRIEDHKKSICVKKSDNSFITIYNNNAEIDSFLNRCKNNILVLEADKPFITSIDFDLFFKFDERQADIELSNTILDEIKSQSRSLLGRERTVFVRDGSDFFVFDVAKREFKAIDGDLVNEEPLKFNKSQVQKAIFDHLRNKYEKSYDRELNNWRSVKKCVNPDILKR